MKRKELFIAFIWCMLMMIGTDMLSYWRRGIVVFFDPEYLRNPIYLIAFLLIVSGMVFGFAKFLTYQNNAK